MSRGVNESELSKVLKVQAYSFNFFFSNTNQTRAHHQIIFYVQVCSRIYSQLILFLYIVKP